MAITTLRNNMTAMAWVVLTAFFTPLGRGRWGVNVLFEGKPGTAKTTVIEAIMRSMRSHCEPFVLSQCDPTDIGGMPVPDVDAGVIRRLPLANFAEIPHRAAIFMDEFSTAPGANKAAALRLCSERQAGEFPLPDGVRIIAAQNSLADTAGGGYALSAASANRWLHYEWPVPNVTAYFDHMNGTPFIPAGFTDADAVEARVMAAWPKVYAKYRALQQAFIRVQPDFLSAQPEENDPAASGPWPSPRTNEWAARLLATAEILGTPRDIRDRMLAGLVGEAYSVAFVAWEGKQDLPDPQDVLDGKVKFVHDPSRMDRSFATLLACTSFLCESKQDATVARVERMWEILGDLSETAADITMEPATRLIHNDLLDASEHAQDMALRIYDTIEQAKAAWA